MADIQKVLDPLTVPKEVKAQAWDAFQQSGDSADFQKRFDSIPLSKEVKAALWEMKYANYPEEAAKAAGEIDRVGFPRKQFAEFGTGVFKGGASTLSGLAKLTQLSRLAPEAATNLKAWSEPVTPWEKAGYVGEQTAEFLAPQAVLTKLGKIPMLAKYAERLSPVLQTIYRVGREATTAGVTREVQTGGDTKQALADAALQGSIFSFGMLTGRIAKSFGEQILKGSLKLTAPSIKEGAKFETIEKYGLSGNLKDMYGQVLSRLNQLGAQRSAILERPVTINLDRLVSSARQDVDAMIESGAGAAQAKQLKGAIRSQIDNLGISEPQQFTTPPTPERGYSLSLMQPLPVPPPPTPVPIVREIDLEKAERIKESFGEIGEWLHGYPVNKKQQAAITTANLMYDKFKTAIENVAAPGEVKAINKQMGELIAFRRALQRRIPVEERQRMFSLDDLVSMMPVLMSGNVGKLPIMFGWMAQKSAGVGSFLARHAQAPAELSKQLGRMFVSATGQSQ